jgi:hypothetical protein
MMKMSNKLFNSPFEMMLRVLLLLSQDKNKYNSLDRIVLLDFISCYAADFKLPYPNLHGANNYKFGEIANRRKLVQEAIKLLVTRGLVEANIDNGYKFSIAPCGLTYVKTLKSSYAKEYRTISKAVIKKYMKESDENILNLVRF